MVRLPAGTPSTAHAHHILPVAYRSFAPQLLPVTVRGDDKSPVSDGRRRRRRQPESMKETFSQVMVDLLNTGRYTQLLQLHVMIAVAEKRTMH